MKEIIRQWMAKRGLSITLCHRTVVSLFTYEIWDYLGVDDRFYVFNVVYTDTRIIGGLSSLSTLTLETSENIEDRELSVEYILNSLVSVYDTREEWTKHRSKVLLKEDLDRYVAKYVQGVIGNIYSVMIGDFVVMDVRFPSPAVPILLVTFTRSGNYEIPFYLNIGSPSLIQRRNYGVDSEAFRLFVERISNFTGGVVWY